MHLYHAHRLQNAVCSTVCRNLQAHAWSFHGLKLRLANPGISVENGNVVGEVAKVRRFVVTTTNFSFRIAVSIHLAFFFKYGTQILIDPGT
ncbi:hypothetical protein Zmor_015244 [Zophobas morio]|uniref:Uncharacterized protein n=1 Tax=Zophobas morio TaxID=2755281 RepID=A0AA38IJ28_9CUCU|nr:hypothetical protein Zmor_015244 [Zophobas morio]